ncbi:MAG: hypothetical protein ACLP8A_00385 [Methylovirgula sp.]
MNSSLDFRLNDPFDDQFDEPAEVSRLDRLEKRAQAYFKIGRSKANLARLVRATRLEAAASAKMIKILTHEIEAFRPSSRA